MQFYCPGIIVPGANADRQIEQLFQRLHQAQVDAGGPPLTETWGMSPEMQTIIRDGNQLFEDFSLHSFIWWICLHHRDRIQRYASTSSSSSSSSSSAAPASPITDRINQLMETFDWELRHGVCSKTTVELIDILLENWDATLPEAAYGLLRATKTHIEKAQDQRIELSKDDTHTWVERPLVQLSHNGLHDGETAKAMEKYKLLAPTLFQNLFQAVRQATTEMDKEADLRVQVVEAALDLFRSLSLSDEIVENARWMCTSASDRAERAFRDYRQSYLSLVKHALEPMTRDLSLKHLDDLVVHSTARDFSRHADEYRGDLLGLHRVISDFCTENLTSERNEETSPHYFFFVLSQILGNTIYPSDRKQDLENAFKPWHASLSGSLKNQDTLSRLCEIKLKGQSEECQELFIRFKERCNALTSHNRALEAHLRGLMNLSKTMSSTLEDLTPSQIKKEDFVQNGTLEEFLRSITGRSSVSQPAVTTKAEQKISSATDLGEIAVTRSQRGSRKKSRTARQQRRAQTAVRVPATSQPPSSSSSSSHSVSLESPPQPVFSPSPSVSFSSKSVEGITSQDRYMFACDQLIEELRDIAELGQSPVGKAKQSALAHVEDALLELRDLPSVHDAAALADHVNSLLYAVSLASEQTLFSLLLQKHQVTNPTVALKYASHHQHWLVQQLDRSDIDVRSVDEIDRLEFHVRSLYSNTSTRNNPDALKYLYQAEYLRKGQFTHEQAIQLVRDVHTLVQRQLTRSLGLLEYRLSAEKWGQHDEHLSRTIAPSIHIPVAEGSGKESESRIYQDVRSKISEDLWNSEFTSFPPSPETFYADAERNLALIRSRQRRGGDSLRNRIKQTLRGKAQFLLHLGIAKGCERGTISPLTPLWNLTHNMWEYVAQAGLREHNFTPDEIEEIYRTGRTNTIVRYQPFREEQAGSFTTMIGEINALNWRLLSFTESEHAFQAVASPADLRQARRLQNECAAQFTASLSVAHKLLR